MKKPTKAKWLLGEEYPTDIDIEWKGRIPRMSWKMNDKIKRWGITWRDSTPTNAVVSLGINGDLESALMMSHGMTLLVLIPVEDDMWPDALATLVAVHPIRAGDGEDDYIVVVLDTTLCHMEMCVGAQERGLQFPEGYGDVRDDIIVAFTTVEATMKQANKERAEAAAKPSKRPCAKKSNAAAGGHEVGDETIITGEFSRSKQKSTSPSGEREASRAKKDEGKLMLAVVIPQANNLTSKTKPSDVEATYKSLEDGLEQCFSCGQDPLPCKISADKIHLAPDSLKYRVFVEKRKEQVQLEREALGTICRKPELYCIPLKRAPVLEGGPEDKGEGLILQAMLALDMQWIIDGQTMAWYQADVHWYVVGGQHTYQACVSIAAKEEPGLARHKFYTEFDMVSVYSRDPDMLIKVSNALNIQVKDKVVN